jgi:hypothetical protein
VRKKQTGPHIQIPLVLPVVLGQLVHFQRVADIGELERLGEPVLFGGRCFHACGVVGGCGPCVGVHDGSGAVAWGIGFEDFAKVGHGAVIWVVGHCGVL